MSSIMAMGAGAVSDGDSRSNVSPLKKAIKDYQDKMFTGLTDDERKEIEAKVAAYREKCEESGMDPRAIQSACDNYYKSLLKEYGAKFDPDFASALAGADGAVSETRGGEGTAGASGVKTNAAKSPEAGTANKSGVSSEVQTEIDGTVYLIFKSPNGINMKIKIGNAEDSEEDLEEGVKKAKNNAGVMDYEKNIDSFFDEGGGMSVSS